MVETNPSYNTALCYSADDMRRMTEGMACVEGVSNVMSGALKVTSATPELLTVSVAQGGAFIAGDTSNDQGMYWVYNDAPVEVELDPGHDLFPRIDQIIARVYDSQYSGSGDEWVIEKWPGTATSGATLASPLGAATLPDNAIRLAYVLVPADHVGAFVDANHILDARMEYTSCGKQIPPNIQLLDSNLSGQVVANNTDTAYRGFDLDASQNPSPDYFTWPTGSDYGVVTVKQAGLYLVTATVGTTFTATGRHAAYIARNNTSTRLAYADNSGGGSPWYASLAWTGYLSAGEFIFLGLFQVIGAPHTFGVHSQTWLSLTKLA